MTVFKAPGNPFYAPSLVAAASGNTTTTTTTKMHQQPSRAGAILRRSRMITESSSCSPMAISATASAVPLPSRPTQKPSDAFHRRRKDRRAVADQAKQQNNTRHRRNDKCVLFVFDYAQNDLSLIFDEAVTSTTGSDSIAAAPVVKDEESCCTARSSDSQRSTIRTTATIGMATTKKSPPSLLAAAPPSVTFSFTRTTPPTVAAAPVPLSPPSPHVSIVQPQRPSLVQRGISASTGDVIMDDATGKATPQEARPNTSVMQPHHHRHSNSPPFPFLAPPSFCQQQQQ